MARQDGNLDMRLDEKVAIVTGGGGGIGGVFGRALAARGASVLLADLDEERGEGGRGDYHRRRHGTSSSGCSRGCGRRPRQLGRRGAGAWSAPVACSSPASRYS
jgi:NAD(P)-dependent dehydrogenase (short-subunit alcohol dehydrogenase family)